MVLTQSKFLPWKLPHQSPLIQYEIGALKNLIYLIVNWNQKLALWVDPQSDISRPLEDLKIYGLSLQGVLLTHTHPDHTAGVSDLLKLQPEVPIYLHSLEAHRLKNTVNTKSMRFLKDNELFFLGDLKLRSIHTPGHSAGALTYETEDLLLTGDTLFIGDCGRTDLPTGSTEEMLRTLMRYQSMSPRFKIFPGHHYRAEYWSTLEEELQTNPALQCKTIQELESLP